MSLLWSVRKVSTAMSTEVALEVRHTLTWCTAKSYNSSLRKHHRWFETEECVFFLSYSCARLITGKLTALMTCIAVWESSICLYNALSKERFLLVGLSYGFRATLLFFFFFFHIIFRNKHFHSYRCAYNDLIHPRMTVQSYSDFKLTMQYKSSLCLWNFMQRLRSQ